MQAKIEKIYNIVRLIILAIAVLLIGFISLTESRYKVVYTINPGETAARQIDTIKYYKFKTYNHGKLQD